MGEHGMKKYFIMILIIICSVLYAEDTKLSVTADNMEYKKEKTFLTGKAKIITDDMIITGDSIELHGKDNRYIRVQGNVNGSDEKKGFEFQSSELEYDKKLKISMFRGNVKLIDKKNSVVANATIIEYIQTSEIANMSIGVIIEKNDMKCYSSFAAFKRNENTLKLKGCPRVIKKTDIFNADIININLETEKIDLSGSVQGTMKM